MSVEGMLLAATYIGLYAGFGLICGLLVMHGLKSQRQGPPYTKAWLAYVGGVTVCFGFATLIWKVDQSKIFSESYRLVGLVIAVVCFVAPLLLRRSAP